MYGLISGVLVAGGELEIMKMGFIQSIVLKVVNWGTYSMWERIRRPVLWSTLEPAIMYIQVFHLTAPTVSI